MVDHVNSCLTDLKSFCTMWTTFLYLQESSELSTSKTLITRSNENGFLDRMHVISSLISENPKKCICLFFQVKNPFPDRIQEILIPPQNPCSKDSLKSNFPPNRILISSQNYGKK